MPDVTHRIAEARSLALHTEVARELCRRPELLDRARERVARWRDSETVPRPWAEAWADILAGSLEEVIVVLTDPGQRSCDLRQASPFAGALDPRRRWSILRRVHREALHR